MTNSLMPNANPSAGSSPAPKNPPHEGTEVDYAVSESSPARDHGDYQRRRPTLANWLEPENYKWSFRHVHELMPTARVARGERPLPLPRRESSEHLPGIDELIRTGNNTDGLLVIHDGAVVCEAYAQGMRPDDTHMLWSISKSIAGTLAGVLVERGALAPEDDVITHVPELVGTSFEGARVRDLLDMRAGSDYDETHWAGWQAQFGWSPETPPKPDAIAYLASFTTKHEHGGPFVYRSLHTDLLGLVLERAGRAPLPSLISSELWAPMGAESAADLTVDRHGFAAPNTGMSTTLRDLGRFGTLLLTGRTVDGRQIVPVSWIEDTLRGAPDSAAAFAGNKYQAYFPDGFYRNNWWVLAGGGVLVGLGSCGQHLYVDRNASVVVAHFSSLPLELAFEKRAATLAAFRNIADYLGGRPQA